MKVEGKAAREAGRRRGVRPSTAYYWIRKAAAQRQVLELASRAQPSAEAASLLAPAFVRLVRSGDEAAAASSLELRIGGVTVVVRRSFDASLLRSLLRAVVEARTEAVT